MTQKNIKVAMIALAIIALVGWFVPVQQTIDSESFKNYVDATLNKLGGATNYDSLELSDNLTVGGTASITGAVTLSGALSSGGLTQGGGSVDIASGAQTLTQAQLASNSILVATASTTAAAFTWTLPATSTMTTLLPNDGDSRMWLFSNENTAAATTTTIAAGTGIILLEPDGQNVVIGGGNRAKLECWRDNSTDVYCNVDELIDAD